MSVAVRTITRLQDADDINVSLGAGVDEYALVYDHDTAKFVLRAPAAPFAGLLATGATVGATAQAQAFTLGVTVGSVTSAATLLQVAETSTASPRGIMSSQHSAGVDGARFHMRKSRGTDGSPTVITTGDVLGQLVASGFDGTNYLEMGGIDIVSAGTIASTRVPTEIRFLTATDAAPSVLTQRMVIDKAGNVGIGTASPASLLQVTGTVFLNGTLDVGDTAYRDSTVAFSLKSNRNWLFNFYDNSVAAKLGLKQTGEFMIGPLTGTSRLSVYGNMTVGLGFYTTAAPTNGAIIQGDVGIGTLTPATKLHICSEIASTDAVRNILTLDSLVTGAGVGAAGLGSAVLFTMETTTTANTSAASVQAVMYEATHATRKFDLVLNAYDTAIREGLRIRGNGSAPSIGFLGATPIARIAHVADPVGGATVDAEARSAINSILTTLENFGFHATS